MVISLKKEEEENDFSDSSSISGKENRD